MAVPADDQTRVIIPRWRDFRTTVALGELSPVGESRVATKPTATSEQLPEILRKLRSDFDANPGPAFAGDLLSTATALRREDAVQDIAQAVMSWEQPLAPAVRRMAERTLGIDANELTASVEWKEGSVGSGALRKRVSQIKHRLRLIPANAFDWMDIGLLYESLGQRAQAERAVEAANALAPQNRFVLRSSARFWIHRNDFERAHRLLTRASNVRRDPWLLAAEIAAASVAGRISKNLKAARNWASSGQLEPRSASEMASAVATEELQSGGIKVARKLFRVSLENPTENAVAQASWADRRYGGAFSWQMNLSVSPWSPEAVAVDCLRAEKWDEAITATGAWLMDQPFSVRPALNASFLFTTALNNPRAGIEVCRFGLLANPHDVTLRNNLAFALCLVDRPEEAEVTLRGIGGLLRDEGQDAVLAATRGLVLFRKGQPEVARREYMKAIEFFERSQQPGKALRARLYLALEEVRLGNLAARESAAQILAESVNIPDYALHAAANAAASRLRGLE